MFDSFREECGVVGVFGHPEASNLVYLGLYSLQHRGQESAGIVSSNGAALFSHRQMGLVADIFREEIIRKLKGRMAIGHNRYSTFGDSLLKNCQPLVVEYNAGAMAVAHNGNIVNADEIRKELERNGSIFQSTTDTEVIIHLIATSRERDLISRLIDGLGRVQGAYSLLLMTESQMVAARDPLGFRPLVLGRLGKTHVISSETCALDLVGANYVREVYPGELIVFDDKGMRSLRPFEVRQEKKCVFEYVYFARPDSTLYGHNVYLVRKELGRQLARESPVQADLVTPVPDSGMPAAIGYAEESRIPLEMGLIRNHYVGRTFIEPSDSIRHFGVKIKLNSQREVLNGKRVVVVDDSIVRGTTSRKIIGMLREAGAKEVHMRISSPPTTHPCFYGVDTPTRAELIASSHSVEEIRNYLGADSLAYLSENGLYAFFDRKRENFCDACFTGNYPVPFAEQPSHRQLHLFEAVPRKGGE